MERDSLEEALETLGEVLHERGQHVGLLVIGGSSLLLLGFVSRPTADVDVAALAGPAATDQGPRSKHLADLQALRPSTDELLTAARWARTHDPSGGFLGELRSALTTLGVEVRDGDI